MSVCSSHMDALCELAEAYVLGSCSAEEKTRFERHLSDCARCQHTVALTADAVAMIAPRKTPRPAVREKLQHALAREEQPAGHDASIIFQSVGVLARRAEEMDWQEGPLPGIWTKTLFLDSERGCHTSIVKLAPGAKYPAHRHAAVEELFILAGDLHYDEGVVVAGDYCRAEPDSIHSPSYTENGCVVLISSSLADELIPD